jgi:uncharacterized cupin superfamily protein
VAEEAQLERTSDGTVAVTDGWFVLSARQARWDVRDGLAARLSLEGETRFPQLGIALYVASPGEPIGMYHSEPDQEDFLILSDEALVIVEGQERDFFHCPANTNHTIIGRGQSPCAVLAVGAREHQHGEDWGGYRVAEPAMRHGAGVAVETSSTAEAYSRFPPRRATRYRDAWLADWP